MSTPSAPSLEGDGELKGKDASQQRIRRRNRMITSCLECRRRKLKCDKLHPCTNCQKFSRDCMFLAPALDSVSQKKLNELKEKMGSLEKVLEDDIARRTNVRSELGYRRRPSADLPGEDSHSDTEAPAPEDEKNLETTPMAAFDAAYEDGSNGDVLDTGIRVGMLRLTERIGGMVRPRFSEELALSLGTPIRKDLNDPDMPRLPDHDDFISPGPTYIAPGAGIMFGEVSTRRNLVDFLPAKATADTLIRRYYRCCHFVARAVHWPSFQAQYESFWTDVLSGIEPQFSLQAVVMSVLFSAVASMEEESIVQLFGNPKQSILMNFQTATEVALAKAHFLRTTRVETLQALVIYLIPMCRDALSRAHTVLIGLAIRLAECMGLHRDPAEHYAISPVEAHVRRIIWFQLCFLDFHTADKQGPRPFIRREDYDTRFPLNMNDADLMANPSDDSDTMWTDMTLSRLRFECCEMWRIARVDVERLHQKKISVTRALGKIESFRRAMEAKYHSMLDIKIPIQRFAKLVLSVSILKMYVATLSRYHNAPDIRMPDRLCQVIITAGTQACEDAIKMYRDPELAEWRWYAPALHAWPTAIILLQEVFKDPQRREADRIWAILDFVYSPTPTLSREQKARQILCAIRDRLAFYRDIRGFRIPVSMKNPLEKTIPIRTGSKMENLEALHARESTYDGFKSEDGTTNVQIPSVSTGKDTNHKAASMASPSNAPKSESSWTFDNPASLFVSKPQGPRGQSRHTSVSPSGIHPIQQPPQLPAAAMQYNPNEISSLDTGASPSSSIEHWPPSISSEHHGWRYAFGSPSPTQQPQQLQQTQQKHTSPPPSLTYDRSQTQSQSSAYSTPPIGQMSNLYMSQPNATSVPFVSVEGDTNHAATSIGMTTGPPRHPGDTMMVDIDWAEWDKIFPPGAAGSLDQPDFRA